jgi:serine/threonine-protein kinase
VLPFPDLENPNGVAVDTAGNVYVIDKERVLELAAGASGPTVIRLPGLEEPDGVAVDTAGNLYVTDFHRACAGISRPCPTLQTTHRLGTSQVLKLAPGSNAPTVLSFTDLEHADGVAVDTAGSVYVTDNIDDLVLKLPAQ